MTESKYHTDCFALQTFNPTKKRWVMGGETFWTKEQAEWCREYMQDFTPHEIRVVHIEPVS